MADIPSTDRRAPNAWLSPQFLLTVGTLVFGGIVAWASLMAEVRGHETRLSKLEIENRDSSATDLLILQRLATIETRIGYLVDAEGRRQQREDRMPRQ